MEEQQGTGVPGSVQAGKIGRPSSRFETLRKELIRLRPDVTDDNIAQLILEKKRRVGGGFLTDQGALFLVASDLGVTLKPMLTDSVRLSELQPDMNDLLVVARVLTLGPPKMYAKNGDLSAGFVFRLVLYDLSSTAPMSIWNNLDAWKLIRANVQPGDGVRIKGAYTRSVKDSSRVSLFLSERGEIERANESDSLISAIPIVSKIAVGLDQIESIPEGTSLVVKGAVCSAIRTQQFRRKDASESQFISFSLSSTEKESDKNRLEMRVIIWDNSNPRFEKLRMGSEITLLNVKPKSSEFFGSKTLELHGDATTDILEHWDESKVWFDQKVDPILKQISKSGRTISVESKVQNTLPFIARALSLGQDSRQRQEGPLHLLVIDASKRRISLTVLEDAMTEAADLKVDDVVLCKPDSFDAIGLKAHCTKKGSISRVKPERNDIPKSVSLVSQIEKLEPNTIATIDCMILSVTASRDLQTKEGLVKRSEALVADPTGEARLYAWRSLAKHLDGLSPGTRLWLRAAEVQSLEGKKFLVFKNYSRIEVQT